MEITSKGIQSEFIFHNVEAIATDHGDCISVRTPRNPDYFFGNFLLFPTPPNAGDFVKWMARFTEIFAPYPAVRHHTFQWLPSGASNSVDLDEFKTAGFTIDETSVLSATSVHTDKPTPTGVVFREIKTDAEWRAVIDAQSEGGHPGVPQDEFVRYKEESFANYRRMAENGLGDWWGAFKGEELVADLGLYFGEDVGRFQSVETATAHRRQGICRAMVRYVSDAGFAKHPGITLMLHADYHDVARRIYRSLGYTEIEVLQSAFRAPI